MIMPVTLKRVFKDLQKDKDKLQSYKVKTLALYFFYIGKCTSPPKIHFI